MWSQSAEVQLQVAMSGQISGVIAPIPEALAGSPGRISPGSGRAAAMTAAAQESEEREERLRRDQEAEAALRSQLAEAEAAALAIKSKYNQASVKMDAEKARLARELAEQQTLAKTKVLAADIAEGTAEALRQRLTQNQATSAAVLGTHTQSWTNQAPECLGNLLTDSV